MAMGTVVADRISLARGWMEEPVVSEIEQLLWRIIHKVEVWNLEWCMM